MTSETAQTRSARWRRRFAWIGVALVVAYGLAIFVAWSRVWLDDDLESVVHGTDASGSIEHAHPIPPWGDGFDTYSLVGSALGRQYVHRRVRDVWIDATTQLAHEDPERTYRVAETARPSGGSFWPHRTHQRGLAMDIMVPLRDSDGGRVSMPTWPWDGFGYANELDDHGRLGQLTLDAAALARLLCTLVRVAPAHGASVRRFILAPELQPDVTAAGDCHLGHRWMREQPWVRHDEHVHVDFDVD